MNDSIRDVVLEAVEASLEAQLGAIRRLRKAEAKPAASVKRSKSQISMVEDVLIEAGTPLHLREIIQKVNEKFAVRIDPDSIGSALTKRVVKGQRFSRPSKNTFGLLERS